MEDFFSIHGSPMVDLEKFDNVISVLDSFHQQQNIDIPIPALFFLTELVPYGMNEAASLSANHRRPRHVEQRENKPNIEDSVFQTKDQTSKQGQTFQNGMMEYVPYQTTITNNDLEWSEQPNALPIESQAISVTDTTVEPVNLHMEIHNKTIDPISLKSATILAYALGHPPHDSRIGFSNGIIDWKTMLEPFSKIKNLGTSVQTLNSLCDLLCIPWNYKDDDPIGLCNLHLHEYLHTVFNIRFAPVEGGHRQWCLSRLFQAKRLSHNLPLARTTQETISFPPQSTLTISVSVGFVYPKIGCFNKKVLKELQIYSRQAQTLKKDKIIYTSYAMLYRTFADIFGQYTSTLQSYAWSKMNGYLEFEVKENKAISEWMKMPLLDCIHAYLITPVGTQKQKTNYQELLNSIAQYINSGHTNLHSKRWHTTVSNLNNNFAYISLTVNSTYVSYSLSGS